MLAKHHETRKECNELIIVVGDCTIVLMYICLIISLLFAVLPRLWNLINPDTESDKNATVFLFLFIISFITFGASYTFKNIILNFNPL
jgi:hypothetical protein